MSIFQLQEFTCQFFNSCQESYMHRVILDVFKYVFASNFQDNHMS